MAGLLYLLTGIQNLVRYKEQAPNYSPSSLKLSSKNINVASRIVYLIYRRRSELFYIFSVPNRSHYALKGIWLPGNE